MRGIVFVLAPDRSWIPIGASEEAFVWTSLTIEKKSSAEFVLLSECTPVIQIRDSFQLIQVSHDFYECMDPPSGRRVGVLLSSPEDCKALEAHVKGAVVAAIKSKSQLLPRPSELTEDIIVLFDENLLRYDYLPATWTPINQQFGVDIKLLHTSSVDGIRGRVPSILVKLEQELQAIGGHNVEGIFRVPADVQKCNLYKQKINEGSFGIIDDAHIIGSLMKYFFRDLPVKLFKGPETYHAKSSDEILGSLTEEHFPVSKWLIKFLSKIAANEAVNRMTARNLAIVFAPNVFDITMDEFSIENSKKAIELLEWLVISG